VPLLRGIHPADGPLDRVHAHSAARQSGSQTASPAPMVAADEGASIGD